jgi:hypothetical protein
MKTYFEKLQNISKLYGLILFRAELYTYYLVNEDGQIIESSDDLDMIDELLCNITDNYLLAIDKHAQAKIQDERDQLIPITHYKSDNDEYTEVYSIEKEQEAKAINSGYL